MRRRREVAGAGRDGHTVRVMGREGHTARGLAVGHGLRPQYSRKLLRMLNRVFR